MVSVQIIKKFECFWNFFEWIRFSNPVYSCGAMELGFGVILLLLFLFCLKIDKISFFLKLTLHHFFHITPTKILSHPNYQFPLNKKSSTRDNNFIFLFSFLAVVFFCVSVHPSVLFLLLLSSGQPSFYRNCTPAIKIQKILRIHLFLLLIITCKSCNMLHYTIRINYVE